MRGSGGFKPYFRGYKSEKCGIVVSGTFSEVKHSKNWSVS